MASVTVPGTGGSSVTVPIDGTFASVIAQQIANAMAGLPSSSITTTGSGAPTPPPPPAPNALIITGGGGANNANGYTYIVNDNTSPNSIGGDVAIISGTVGGSFFVSEALE